MAVTLHVCTTCRGSAEASAAENTAARNTGPQNTGPDAPRPGAALLARLSADPAPAGVTIVPVECLSACKTGCAVALSAPGRWSYVYGRLTPEDAPEILAGAAAYAEAPDGIVPWRARPQIFRKQSIARIPPISAAPVSASQEG